VYPREQGGSGSINSWSTEAIGSKEGAFYKFMEHRSHREQGGSSSINSWSTEAIGSKEGAVLQFCRAWELMVLQVKAPVHVVYGARQLVVVSYHAEQERS